MITGKAHLNNSDFPEPPEPEQTNPKIDHEALLSYDRGNIVKLLDDAQSSPSPTVVPIPPRITSNVSRPECRNPFNEEIDLPAIVKELLSVTEDMTSSTFVFDASEGAAATNWDILCNHNFDLTTIIGNERNHTSFGSELKQIEWLEKLWWKHPRWNRLKKSLTNGVTFPVRHLDEELRRQDVIAAFTRGNHKSAFHKKCFLENEIVKEVKKGWNILLPGDTYDKLPGLVLSPMGVATHTGICSDGTFVEKDRVTHDLSFPGAASKESVNSRVISTELEPCMFSYVLLRLIHYVVNLRRRHRESRIWLRKEDYKSAFRRIHLSAKTALEAAVTVEIAQKKYIAIPLRMPFGGAPCPSEFALFSDMITDTINDLLKDKNWDNTTIFSDVIKDIPPPIPLPDNIPFSQAKPMRVELPDEDFGKADVFLDDIISCIVDKGDNLDRITKAPSTIIEATARQGSTMGVKRDPMIEPEKAKAEGPAEEVKIILGWTIDTRRLLISLPKHKFIGWTSQIDSVLDSKTVSNKTLMSV